LVDAIVSESSLLEASPPRSPRVRSDPQRRAAG
jgi:hypothetical protein